MPIDNIDADNTTRQVGSHIIHPDLSYKIVGILYEVYNELGYGYQEKYYEKAVSKCLKLENIPYIEQAPYKISFKGDIIGRYFIDFVVDNKIVLELKRGDYFSQKHIEQIKGYLKATDLRLAILAHFTSNGVKIFRALNPNNIIINS